MPIFNTAKYGEVVFLPQQPQRPMTEILEWATDVFTAHNGTEKRKGIRNSARQTFDMNFPVRLDDVPRAFNMIYAGLNRTWLVGLWTEAQTTVGIPEGATYIAATTEPYSFRDGDLALVWASPTEYSIVTIAGISADGLALSTPVDRSYSEAMLLPMRSAKISGKPTRTTKGYDSVITIRYDVLDNDLGDTEVPPEMSVVFARNLPDWQYTQQVDNGQPIIPTSWQVGKGIFGTSSAISLIGTFVPAGIVGKSTWIRRVFSKTDLPGDVTKLGFLIIFDDSFKIWFNGVQLEAKVIDYFTAYYLYEGEIQDTNEVIIQSTDGLAANGNPYGDAGNTWAGLEITADVVEYDTIYEEIEIPDGGMVEESVTRASIVDYESGKIAAFYPWLNTKLNKTQRRTTYTPEENAHFKKWLRKRAGRLNPFWRPTFERDFRVVSTGMIESALLVRDDDLNQFSIPRKHIAFKLNDGQWVERTIIAHVGMPNNIVELTLDAPLNADASSIDRVSYLGLYRLDTDHIEMEWGGGICISEYPMTEIAP